MTTLNFLFAINGTNGQTQPYERKTFQKKQNQNNLSHLQSLQEIVLKVLKIPSVSIKCILTKFNVIYGVNKIYSNHETGINIKTITRTINWTIKIYYYVFQKFIKLFFFCLSILGTQHQIWWNGLYCYWAQSTIREKDKTRKWCNYF